MDTAERLEYIERFERYRKVSEQSNQAIQKLIEAIEDERRKHELARINGRDEHIRLSGDGNGATDDSIHNRSVDILPTGAKESKVHAGRVGADAPKLAEQGGA